MTETRRSILRAVLAVAALAAALLTAGWAAAQPSSAPGRQALMYLAVPLTAALLSRGRGRSAGEVLTVGVETLLLPALLAAQLVRLGVPADFAWLMIALQAAAVLIGWLVRR